MEFAGFPAATSAFLTGIAAHNDKPWFEANRALYDEGYVAAGRAFAAALGPRLREISPTVQFDPKQSLGRVNRDIRFSKDKRPYKTRLSVWFWHGDRKGWDRPGFWFSLSPETAMLGVGLHGLEGEFLESFRQSVIHPRSARTLLAAVETVTAAGYRIGEKSRKLTPRGYPADGPAAEYLLHESLDAAIELPAAASQAPDFLDVCVAHYAAMWPIAKWLLDEVGTAE